jgi:hypothetical protein
MQHPTALLRRHGSDANQLMLAWYLNDKTI